jgi:hypothetical protein
MVGMEGNGGGQQPVIKINAACTSAEVPKVDSWQGVVEAERGSSKRVTHAQLDIASPLPAY